MDTSRPLTELLRRAGEGDATALNELFAIAYEDLRRMAHHRLRASTRGSVLGTTALVHESYFRFVNAGRLRIEDRAHFFRYASQVMRSVIVDLARARASERRGGGVSPVTLNTAIGDGLGGGEVEILRVHEALADLARLDERLATVVEMRYFAGFTEAEIAESLGINERTVRRDWEKARLLLAKALE